MLLMDVCVPRARTGLATSGPASRCQLDTWWVAWTANDNDSNYELPLRVLWGGDTVVNFLHVITMFLTTHVKDTSVLPFSLYVER